MSVENAENANGGETEAKPQNGDFSDHRPNGISNGHIESNSNSSKHKSSSKDKHRDKDKDYKSSSKSSSSNRDKDSDKYKSSSSSSKDKHRDKDRDRDKDKDKHKSSSSSHKSSSRDKDRDKDREDRKDRDKEKDKERSRDKDKEKDKERSKDKEKSDRDADRKKDHKSSSRDKDREKDRDKDKERHRDKDKDKDKEHKSSSSSKDKHSSSSSSKSKDKDKEREKDRDKHSSSSKDKDRHRDKDRKDRDKDKHSSSSSKKDKVDEKPNIKLEEPEVKEEIKQEADETCDGQFNNDLPVIKENEPYCGTKQEFKDEVMNNSQASSCDYSMSQFRDDEPAFEIKEESADESQEVNIENDTADETDPLFASGGGDMNETHETTTQDQDGSYDDDDDDMPLSKQRKKRPAKEVDSDDDAPLITKKKAKTAKTKEKSAKKGKKKREVEEDEEEEEYTEKPKKKKAKKEKEKPVQVKSVSTTEESPTKGGRKKKTEQEEQDVWRWWEEEKREDGVKWNFLEHKGPVFAPDYEPLPANVKFFYDGKEMKLSQDAEEIASFYARMLNHDYVTKQVFNDNFFKDWRKSMTSKEKETIKHLDKCNFEQMHQYFQMLSEKNKNRSKEEKLALKEANEKLVAEYGFCTIDGHKEKIGNFKLEPPGLFRGRGEHPKMGLVKKRLMPEDIMINCSKDSNIPQPPKGHKWKEVRHDNSVTWLASWVENIQGQVKYIMLNPSSKLKGEKDYMKYETARRLDKHIDKIRHTYREEWKSKEMRIRQRAVALYFIDKLALRAGNEKDEDQADTVGCCSLRVEHIALHKEMDGKENVVVFDFLGKDSIRYYNAVEVEKRVFKNLELFMENKKEGDDLFDRLNTSVLNEHLRDLMEGLTAKVFRTYNASITLQNQLDLLTDPDSSVPEKLLAYNRANRAVAVLCNHQRSVPKGHEKSMSNLKEKIRQKREAIDDCEAELHDVQKAAKRGSVKEKINCDKKRKQLERLKEQLKKLELQETDRDENKTIALGTSKLNYLDPRISVAWCKKFGVPIEKIFNKTQRDKFRWAIHMADENYRF